jgi:multiple sugar transport system ATP-binding protein
MTLADRIVVLNAGRVEQVGHPLEVYRSPRTVFSAGFLGSPKMNFLRGAVSQATDGAVAVNLDGGGAVTAKTAAGGLRSGDKVVVGIRPEHVRVAQGKQGPFTASVQFVEDLGDLSIVHLERETVDGRMLAKISGPPPKEGDVVSYEIPQEDIHVFDPQGLAVTQRAA